MVSELQLRKFKLIEKIIELHSEELVSDLENYLNDKLNILGGIEDVFAPMRENISIAELKKEQNYKATSYEDFKQLTKELDIKESIDDLLR